jgi:hypothetical protein
MRSPFPPSSDRVLRASSDFSRISALRDGIKYRERQSLSARSPTLWPSAALPRAAARQPCPGLDHGETGADHPPCRRLALTRSGAIALFRKFDDQLGDRHCCRIGAIDQPKLTQRGFEGRRQVRDLFGPKRVIVFEKNSNRHVPRPAATCCASEMQLRDSACALGDKSEREPDLSAIRPTSERLYGISVPKPSGVPGGRNAANAAGGPPTTDNRTSASTSKSSSFHRPDGGRNIADYAAAGRADRRAKTPPKQGRAMRTNMRQSF